jgi:hypothetical protein
MRLAKSLILRNRKQNSKLPWREFTLVNLSLENVACALTGPMEQVSKDSWSLPPATPVSLNRVVIVFLAAEAAAGTIVSDIASTPIA